MRREGVRRGEGVRGGYLATRRPGAGPSLRAAPQLRGQELAGSVAAARVLTGEPQSVGSASSCIGEGRQGEGGLTSLCMWRGAAMRVHVRARPHCAARQALAFKLTPLPSATRGARERALGLTSCYHAIPTHTHKPTLPHTHTPHTQAPYTPAAGGRAGSWCGPHASKPLDTASSCKRTGRWGGSGSRHLHLSARSGAEHARA